MILGHIAGFPVEETLLGLGPACLAGFGALLASARGRAARRRERREHRAG